MASDTSSARPTIPVLQPSEPTAPVPAVRLALLLLALRNAGKSVSLLALAGGFAAWKGFSSGARWSGIAVLLLSLLSAVWRFGMSNRRGLDQMNDAKVLRIERELRGNALLAGSIWAIATLCIYPLLDARSAAEYLMMQVGATAVAVHFMTMVRWTFPLLVLPSAGAMVLASLSIPSVRSLPMAALSCIYAYTLLRAGNQYRLTAADAIQNQFDAETANGMLVKAKDAAEAGALAKSQFLATMSHEIRTPMNGVLGSLEMLRRSPLNEEQRHLVRTADSSGQALMALLNDVLDHAKIEAGKLTLQPGPMSLREVAAQVVGLFRANAEAKGLKLNLRCDEQLPEWVIGDSQHLKQVLLNLISNAIKFTDRGSVYLIVSCQKDDADCVVVKFEVQDTGIGIADADVSQLFAPFSRVATAASRSRRGTGLGLTISQRIVEAMGGQIEVTSELGVGAAFHFTVPLIKHQTEPPPPPVDTTSSDFDMLSPLSGTALVVEDDPVNRLIARSQLESLGMTVVEAQDGIEALALAQSQAVDIVFMDCNMPRLDGYATTVRWREREAHLGLRRTPIVAFTADAYEDEMLRTREAGMDGHMIKPYSRAQMKEQLRAWL